MPPTVELEDLFEELGFEEIEELPEERPISDENQMEEES